MEFTINQIAEMLNGEVIGNPNICINQLTKIEEGRVHSLSFYPIQNILNTSIKRSLLQ